MKLAAVYICWDGEELLPYSIANILPLVDDIIIVWSRKSNKGEIGNFNPEQFKYHLVNHEPDLSLTPHDNERAKRNAGLDEAKRLGFTHFLMLDCDEFYDHAQFKAAKQKIIERRLNGLICDVQVFFGSPELTIGKDPATRVPFIHRIFPNLKFKQSRHYPFAYDKNGCRIDPTRQLNVKTGVEFDKDLTMLHYSWVRKDIRIKVRNSSANLARSSCLEDVKNAREGYFCKMYQRELVRCENKFNIQI